MITFDRYTHTNDLIQFYLSESSDKNIERIIKAGVTKADAELFSRFIWQMVDRVHSDEEIGRAVLGRTGNSDMLPDLSYEITSTCEKRASIRYGNEFRILMDKAIFCGGS